MFLTHLHSDHVSGIPDLWLTGTLAPYVRREDTLEVFGPQGTKDMMHYMEKAFAADVSARGVVVASAESQEVQAQDFQEGVVYDRNGVIVRAFLVEHNVIEPAYGFRIEYEGRSVVLSGDTSYCENLIKNAENTDLLIHEVAATPAELPEDYPPIIDRVRWAHTTPDEVGRICEQARPKLAVYSHIHYLLGSTDDDIIKGTRKTYDGEFLVGNDLDIFDVGDSVTKVISN